MRLRLMPVEPRLGWTPYAWLVYLLFYILPAVLLPMETAQRLETALVVAAFLPLYLWGYWLRGGRRLLLVATGIALLGAIAARNNPGAACFPIYAAGFLGALENRRLRLGALAALVTLVAVESWWLGLQMYYWGIAIGFSLLIFGVNRHYSVVVEANQALRRSQQEVERLATLAERERIARDLHDLLGHTLSLITLKAELAGKLLARSPERAAAEIADVERIARGSLAEVREAVAGYRSGGFDDELARAESALTAAGVELEVSKQPLELTPDGERVLALALREAVTNVVRHAGARSCAVRIATGGGEAVLEVADDGRGGDDAEGSGLAGMRERAEALGGRVERSNDGGTVLTVTLPLAPLPPAAGVAACGLAVAGEAAGTTSRPAARPRPEPAR